MSYNIGCMIASDMLFDSRGWVFGAKLSDENIADFEVLTSKGCCHGNHFWLSIYGVHNGDTWRIRLNRPCAAAMRPYVKLLWSLVLIITSSIALSARRQYLIYSEADFEVFHPTGVPHCTDGAKLSVEDLLHAKFHPHRCNDKGIGPLKLKFLLRFDQDVKYKRPAGAYPLCNFHRIRRACTILGHVSC